MIKHPIIHIQRMTIIWVLEKYFRYLNYSDLPSSGLVEFYKSEKTAPEEFSLFGSGTAESPISHLVHTAAPCVQQILNHVIG